MDWNLYLKTAYIVLAILMFAVLPFSLLIGFIMGTSLTIKDFLELLAILSACYAFALVVAAIVLRAD